MHFNLVNTAIAAAVLMPLTLAAPHEARAGAPNITPIPDTCHEVGVYPLPFATSFKTTAAFDSAHQIYSFILNEAQGEDPSFDESGKLYQCLEQCYGYGTPGSCKGVLWSYNATHLEYGYQTTGVGCFMYDQAITRADLVDTTDMTYTRARAINIKCPA